MADPRTYLRVVYLFLAFPLGTVYFTVLVTGLSVGIGTAIVMVGFVVLILTLLVWLLFARIERELAIHLLGAHIRPMFPPDPTPISPRQRLLRTLGDPVTWKSLAYLLVEFPFGIFSFTVGVSLISISLSLILYPVIDVVMTALSQQGLVDTSGTMFPGVGIDGTFHSSVFVGFLVISAFGVGFAAVSLALMNGLGWLWARFAEYMLGTDETSLQLAAAKAEAQVEHTRADQADQSRRALIVNASHELRTPVASISAHVESLLKPGRELDQETRNYLQVVAAETDRLGSLVDDVLALARAGADDLHPDIQPVDRAALLHPVRV